MDKYVRHRWKLTCTSQLSTYFSQKCKSSMLGAILYLLQILASQSKLCSYANHRVHTLVDKYMIDVQVTWTFGWFHLVQPCCWLLATWSAVLHWVKTPNRLGNTFALWFQLFERAKEICPHEFADTLDTDPTQWRLTLHVATPSIFACKQLC